MPGDPRARAIAAVDNFITELRAAFERAGPPTYARLEELSERCHDPNPATGPRVLVLPHSTTHDILTSKRGSLPSWPWVLSFVHVLRVAAAENGLEPDAIGANAEWHARYLAARSALQQAPLAAPTPPAATSLYTRDPASDGPGTVGPRLNAPDLLASDHGPRSPAAPSTVPAETSAPAAIGESKVATRAPVASADVDLSNPYAVGPYAAVGDVHRLPDVEELEQDSGSSTGASPVPGDSGVSRDSWTDPVGTAGTGPRGPSSYSGGAMPGKGRHGIEGFASRPPTGTRWSKSDPARGHAISGVPSQDDSATYTLPHDPLRGYGSASSGWDARRPVGGIGGDNPAADSFDDSVGVGKASRFSSPIDSAAASEQVEERLKTVPPPKETIRWRRYVEAYGRTGMRLLRHAEADDGKAEGIPAYQLATLLACERRPNEALYWMQRAALAGHDHARQLTAAWGPVADSKPPGDWRPADVAHEIGLQYEATGQPFSAAVFFVRAAENGHAEAAYRAGLHNMQIGRPWDAMLMFSRAAGAGHEPALHELDGVLPRAHHVPTVAMLPYWLPENSTAGLALPVIPFDDRDAT